MKISFKKILFTVFLSLLLTNFLLVNNYANAAATTADNAKATNYGLETVAGGAELKGSGTDPVAFAGKIIGVALSLLGIFFMVIIIYAGFKWMNSIGEPDGVKEAQTMIKRAVMGVIVIVAAYAITQFVLAQIAN